MRINKYIAQCGIASRRKAEELVNAGRIKVNGEILFDLSYQVDESDIITFDDKIIQPTLKKYYLMLNKPVGYVCTNEDKYAEKTIFDLIDIKDKLFSIGRLDSDSRGLILITNDGMLYNRIMHPRNEIFKKYEICLDRDFLHRDKTTLENGVDIGGYVTAKSKLHLSNYNKKNVVIEISEGKKRQIRRMFKALGYNVIDLNRVAIQDLQLGNLKLSEYRHLTEKEVSYLYSL